MKKVMNKVNFALIAMMMSASAFADEKIQLNAGGGMCDLFTRLHGVFNTLRILAFVGAAFYIAGWAWSYISGGDAKTDDIEKKGKALVIGFSLLFLIGVVLSFVMSAAGMELLDCPVIKKW